MDGPELPMDAWEGFLGQYTVNLDRLEIGLMEYADERDPTISTRIHGCIVDAWQNSGSGMPLRMMEAGADHIIDNISIGVECFDEPSGGFLFSFRRCSYVFRI